MIEDGFLADDQLFSNVQFESFDVVDDLFLGYE